MKVTHLLTLEETIELILKHRSDYERKDILTMIEEKREELGKEVINDESAAMIVARELGVDLHQMSPKARQRIEDITEATRNVAITAKVINIGTVRTFSRKDGGGEGKVGSLMVSDETGKMRVVLWDDLTKAVSEDIISVGDVVQLRGAYVKKGLGDALELNLGRMGQIRVLEDFEIEDLGIDFKESALGEHKISDLEDGMFNIGLKAQVQRVFRLSTFTRQSDGSEGRVLSIVGADETGTTRLVFWDDKASEMESAEEGEIIRISGANTRLNRDGSSIEVHVGRAATIERGLDEKIDAVEPRRACWPRPTGPRTRVSRAQSASDQLSALSASHTARYSLSSSRSPRCGTTVSVRSATSCETVVAKARIRPVATFISFSSSQSANLIRNSPLIAEVSSRGPKPPTYPRVRSRSKGRGVPA